MAYTYTNSTTAGRIYDTFENVRMDDILNKQQQQYLDDEKKLNKDKNTIRYAIVIGSAILILALLKIVVKKK
jgi:hypothetical protein